MKVVADVREVQLQVDEEHGTDFELVLPERRPLIWQDLVEVTVSFALARATMDLRRELLGEELSAFAAWLPDIRSTANPKQTERWDALAINCADVIDSPATRELRVGDQLFREDAGVFWGPEGAHSVHLSGEEMVRLTCLVLSDARTYDSFPHQYAPFLAEYLGSDDSADLNSSARRMLNRVLEAYGFDGGEG